jgi:OFA family oxalate/formate antiporter-like MFS transporter
MSPATKGVVVVLAGLGLTLALGSLCIWVLIGAELLKPLSAGGLYGWSVQQVTAPFALAGGSFAVAMIAGGMLQDRLGPRWPSTAGGVLIGLGMVLASMSEFKNAGAHGRATLLALGLGLMVGIGAGLTLSSVVPPALKWSVPRHHGLILGLVLSGLALGPVWLTAPLGWLMQGRSLGSALLIQGVILLGVIVVLSQLLENPLLGYVPPGSYSDPDGSPISPASWAGLTWRRMLLTPTFRALWASSGLLGAGTAALAIQLLLAPTMRASGGPALGIWVAAGGCLGGVLAGLLHDRTGPTGPWPGFGAVAAALALAAALAAAGQLEAAVGLTGAGLAGAAVVAWACATESFGTRSVGANFGLVFSGLSVGLLVGALSSAATVGPALSGPSSTAGTIVTILAFGLDLSLAVVLAARVRPRATLGVVVESPRRLRGRVRV